MLCFMVEISGSPNKSVSWREMAVGEEGVEMGCYKSWLIGKDSDAGRDWGQEEKGTTEDEMAGWHHWRTWVWVTSGSWWWTGRPGVPQFMGLRRVRHDWVTDLTWIPLKAISALVSWILFKSTLGCRSFMYHNYDFSSHLFSVLQFTGLQRVGHDWETELNWTDSYINKCW